jgi:hypothetical protein
MTIKDRVKIYNSRSNYSLNLHKAFVSDSKFPFEIGENLIATIEGNKVIVEKESEKSI